MVITPSERSDGFSTEAAGVTLLWCLVAFGQIRMRRIDGHRFLSEFMRDQGKQAA